MYWGQSNRRSGPEEMQIGIGPGRRFKTVAGWQVRLPDAWLLWQLLTILDVRTGGPDSLAWFVAKKKCPDQVHL